MWTSIAVSSSGNLCTSAVNVSYSKSDSVSSMVSSSGSPVAGSSISIVMERDFSFIPLDPRSIPQFL